MGKANALFPSLSSTRILYLREFGPPSFYLPNAILKYSKVNEYSNLCNKYDLRNSTPKSSADKSWSFGTKPKS